MYHERALAHYEDPFHKGRLAEPTHRHGLNHQNCGDTVQMELRVEDGKVEECKFEGHGCVISQAAASMLLEHFHGKMIEDVKNFSERDMLALYGTELAPSRHKCCLLPLKVLQGALA
jgi:nitrogen fixation NifU-like protein